MLEVIETHDVVLVLNNCGIGPNGFEPGNTCAKGGGDGTRVGTATTYEGSGSSSQHSGGPVKLAKSQFSESLQAETEAWKESSPTQVKAVKAWTNGKFKQMRQRIASGQLEDQDRELLAALESGPQFEGTVYRGVNVRTKSDYGAKQIEALVKAGVGGYWIDDAPMSTSVDPRSAHVFSKNNLFMKINVKSGLACRNVSQHQTEDEVIAKPGVKYRITGLTKGAKLNIPMGSRTYDSDVALYVEMEEVE